MTQTVLYDYLQVLYNKDIKMTLRYAHLAPAHEMNAVNVLDNLMNPVPELHNYCTKNRKRASSFC